MIRSDQISRSVVSDSLRPHGLQPTTLLCPWDFTGKSTGVGCHCLLCPSSVVGANYRVLICCTCHFQSDSLFFVYFGFLCLQVSSVSNFRPDTLGEGGHLFRLTCSTVLRGGRNTANKYHWRVWGVLAVYGPHWVAPAHGACAFPVYTAQAPGCSAGELSKVGPGLRALPRSKLISFR